MSCAPRAEPLVLLAGMGKTGTMSLSIALAMLGLNVAHFNCVKACRTRDKNGGCNASDVVDHHKLGARYMLIRHSLERAPVARASLCQFDAFGAVGDVPISHLAPLITMPMALAQR